MIPTEQELAFPLFKKPEPINLGIGLKGYVEISVIDHCGNVVEKRRPQRNLILDQGLNQIADNPIGEIFKYCVRGTGTTAGKEEVTGSYTLAGVTVTRVSGARDFTADDVGKLIRSSDNTENIIETFTDATHVDVRGVGSADVDEFTTESIVLYSVHVTELDAEVDRTDTYSAVTGENSTVTAANKRTLKRTFVFDPEEEQLESVTGTYTWTSGDATLTRISGARDFTAADVGKYVKFTVSGQYAKIASFTSATVVELDRNADATETAQDIDIYGFKEYGEIGFSPESAAGANLSIRVRLEDGGGASNPVLILGDNPETPGQQLKVTYNLEVYVVPNTVTGPTAASITDPGNIMSANKNGSYVLESYAISQIATDGETDITATSLEPYNPGMMALSPSTTALSAFGNIDRSAGTEVAQMEAVEYVQDSFTRLYEGTFGINEAIAINWRVMGIYDEDNGTFPFAWLFAGAQKKDGEHTLTLRFRKSWNRDLS